MTKKDEIKIQIKDWIQIFIVAIIFVLIIRNFLFSSTLVIGNSMYPTLLDRDRLFVGKISDLTDNFDRGDIVVLNAPDGPDKDYIKRIIGVEGDTIEIQDGKVYLNGEVLKENYIEKDAYTRVHYDDVWTVPEGQVFVLGDNRMPNASNDSRAFGCVSVFELEGKVKFRYFPLSRIGDV